MGKTTSVSPHIFVDARESKSATPIAVEANDLKIQRLEK